MIMLVSFSILNAVNVNISELDENRYLIEFTNTDYKITENGEYTEIKTDIADYNTIPGKYYLPYLTKNASVPPGGHIVFRVLDQKIETVKLELPLQPHPEIKEDGESFIPVYKIIEEKNTASQQVVKMGVKGKFRNTEYIPLEIHPFIYDSNSRKLNVYTGLTIEVTVSGDSRGFQTGQISDNIVKNVEGNFINPEGLRSWNTMRESSVEYLNFRDHSLWYKIEISETGIHKLTYSELNNVISNLSDKDPTEFRIYSNSGKQMEVKNEGTYNTNTGLPIEEIPLFIAGEDDHSFDSGDYILFYAENRDGDKNLNEESYFNPYSANGVYWLQLDAESTPAERIETQSIAAQEFVQDRHKKTYRYEKEEVEYYYNTLEWYSDNFAYLGNLISSYSYDVPVRDLVTTDPQTFIMRVRQEHDSNSNYRQKIEVFSNDNQIYGESTYEGTITTTNALRFIKEGDLLIEGNNDIEMKVTRETGVSIYLDYFEFSYNQSLVKHSNESFELNNMNYESIANTYRFAGTPESDMLIFEIDNFHNVVLRPYETTSEGFSFNGDAEQKYYIVNQNNMESIASISRYQAEDLTAGTENIQSIILAPVEFMSQGQRLAGIYDESMGINAKVVDQQKVFDQFNCGMPDPIAVQLYCKYLLEEHNQLESLVILGAGVKDWRNFANSSNTEKRRIIIPILTNGITASDDFYTFLENNSKASIMTGRYSAVSESALEKMINKTENYMLNRTPGLWRNTCLVIADDEYNSGSVDQVYHTENAEENCDVINRSVMIDKIYSVEYELDEFAHKPQVRDLIVDAINDGCLYWYYNGHGSEASLGDEKYFAVSDLARLDNIEYLPVFMAASCSVGLYDKYSGLSLGELIHELPSGGSIASIAASRPTAGGANTTFFGTVFRKAVNERKTMGQTMFEIKSGAASRSQVLYYQLFGDPYTPAYPPQKFNTVTFDAQSDTIKALSKATISGSFENNDLNGEATVFVMDTDIATIYRTPNDAVDYYKNGKALYRGNIDVINGQFNDVEFYVPFDIYGGDLGRVIVYLEDEATHEEFIAYNPEVTFRGQDTGSVNADQPEIKIWFENKDYQPGQSISNNPLLIAEISDSNGVNILSKPGHKILAGFTGYNDLWDVTDDFYYYNNSYTKGELRTRLENIPTGKQEFYLIAFDNFNEPGFQKIDCNVSGSSSDEDISISDLLPYPSPATDDDFNFTFVLSEKANVKIKVYTITGKKIKTIEGLDDFASGYNQIEWDLRDDDGDEIANNTYLYKVIATSVNTGKKAEKLGKLPVYK